MEINWKDDLPYHYTKGKFSKEPLYHDELSLLSDQFPIVFIGSYKEMNCRYDIYFTKERHDPHVYCRYGDGESQVAPLLYDGLADLNNSKESVGSTAIIRARELKLINLTEFVAGYSPENKVITFPSSYDAMRYFGGDESKYATVVAMDASQLPHLCKSKKGLHNHYFDETIKRSTSMKLRYASLSL
jgi:hypothetical protein